MKYLLALLFSSSAWAHCPYEFEKEGTLYCLDYSWEKAQIKKRGEYIDTKEMSPVINSEDLRAFRRKTSSAFFQVWKKGDKNHNPVYFEDLRFFPYMIMTDGHHHDASSLTEYKESYDLNGDNTSQKLSGYLVSQISFLDMKVGGCWSFRMTFASENLISSSSRVADVLNYTNLSSERNFDLMTLCEICREEPDDDGGHGGHDHGNHHGDQDGDHGSHDHGNHNGDHGGHNGDHGGHNGTHSGDHGNHHDGHH